MQYISTRGGAAVSGAEAIVRGLAPDGGLYVPQTFPTVTEEETAKFREMDYPTLAAHILFKFLPEFTLEKLLSITQASAARFCAPEVTPLVEADEGAYFLELWHGPTHAFKDVALTTLPLLLTEAKKMLAIETETLVLVATSGDTGKAALEGFKNTKGTKCMVLYPSEGVSPMQRLQMTTQEGDNVAVFGIEGNFDDAQTAVKNIFLDTALKSRLAKAGVELSSANSINLGRLLPQVVYYFSAYYDLADSQKINYGEPVDFCVPTGNFGDILAGYYAKRLGLPVGKLICASDVNDVLTQFLWEGSYSIDRPFYKTISPSMDILISSNLERLLFEASGRDAVRTAELMTALKEKKGYTVTNAEHRFIADAVVGYSATEEETRATIGEWFDDTGYLMDPHTAVAATCAEEYSDEQELGDDANALIILSTASPYKFVDDVLESVGAKKGKDLDESIRRLEETSALEAPTSIKELTRLPIRFKEILSADRISEAVEKLGAKQS